MTTQTPFAGRPPHPSWDRPGQSRLVAYFSMEIAIAPSIPTYSGGLGVLAGDTLRAAADMALPLVAVTLAHRKGYVKQHLDANGVQSEEDQPWDLEAMLNPEDPIVTVLIEERTVAIRAWRYDLEGVTGHTIPIYLLDTDLEENDARDRGLTDHLYGGDGDYRLRQETVLGIGGVRILEALCYRPGVYHLNEGHASLLSIALLEQRLRGRSLDQATDEDMEAVRKRCVFTTHTPVPAGHDRFSMEQGHRICSPRCCLFQILMNDAPTPYWVIARAEASCGRQTETWRQRRFHALHRLLCPFLYRPVPAGNG
jgi:starch phosphorylase